MTEINIDQKFKEFKSRIFSIANSFNKTTGVELEELHSEAIRGFVESFERYNPEYDLEKFIITGICQQLDNFTKKQKRHYYMNKNSLPSEVFGIENHQTETETFELADEFIKHKNPIVRHIWALIIDNDLPPKCPKYGWLDKQLQNLGFRYSKIWRAFTEVKTLLQEV